MAKIRHLAFICKDPVQMGEFLQKAFDLEILYTQPSGVTVVSDGEVNITLLTDSFVEHDPVLWHFGIEMSQDEIEAKRARWEELGTPLRNAVHDGRPVEAFIHTTDGFRIDVAPFWPTKKGQSRRQEEYREWEKDPAAAGQAR
jgi:hypothetical protein